jgi:OOP family OmpA-OmpF porin
MTSLRRVAGCGCALLFLVLGAPPPGAQPVLAPAAGEEAESCVGKARLYGLGFETDGFTLDSEDAVILDLVADAIQERCSGKIIVIEGHTDVSGDPEHNRRLSERRAGSVRDYLVERGVPADQLRIEGFGEDHPLTTDPSPEAQARNRRVTLRSEPGAP